MDALNSNTYRQDLNKGLPTSFVLENGKFQLIGGERKVEDNMRMLMVFLKWFRMLLTDFIPNVLWAYQRNTSVIHRFKNIFRLQFLRAAEKYCPFAELKAVDFPTDLTDRRRFMIDLEFRYRLDKQSTFRPVRFTIAK